MDNYVMALFKTSQPFLLGLYFIAVFCLTMIFPELGLQSFALATLSTVLLMIILIPTKWALIFTFTYIGVEGFLKVVSNYHPVIHVGGDLLVLFVALKVTVESMLNWGKEGFISPPLLGLFLLHYVWIAVVFFNPSGLGLIPSLAGAKVYTVMLLLFYFGFYKTETMEDAEDYIKPFLIVTLLHTGFGIYQGLVGAESVLALHPRYALQLEKYKNTAFRPFGLTNLPGGPAVFMSFAFPLILYFIFTVRNHLLRIFYIAYLPAGIFLFLLCQIRSSLAKMLIGSTFFLIGTIRFISRGQQRVGMIMTGLALVTMTMIYFLPQLVQYSIQSNVENEDAVDRSLSLFDLERVSHARRGTWDRFVTYATEVPFGAGFSRVGAAAGKFTEERRQDTNFNEHYFFADNFWIAALIEIGIPGMIIMTLILIFILQRSYRIVGEQTDYRKKLLSLALFGALAAMVVGLYGSEGILYNPDACFFWFFSGVLLKIPYLKYES